MVEDQVIVVNGNDEPLGVMPKLQAHEDGILHRAVSVFVFNSKGEWLIQKRANAKYHSGGLWSNTCCSHPFPDEPELDAANRRLTEEMGMKCQLTKLLEYKYYAKLDNGLIENEYDHVFFGITDSQPQVNEDEASEFMWISTQDLELGLTQNPHDYTAWFKLLIPQVIKQLAEINQLDLAR